MGKRSRDESKEERRERKKAKKEAKKLKKERKSLEKKASSTLLTEDFSGDTSRTPRVVPKTEGIPKKSVFVKKNIELAVSLLPATLRNTEESVHSSIRQLLLKYSDGIGGILLAFDTVRIMSDKHSHARGFILNELPYIHYNVTCNALVFSPTTGTKVS